jgi:hypothetical protein
VRITTDSDVLTKGRAWWRLPKFPAHIEVAAGPLISTDTAASTPDMAAGIEAWFHGLPVDAGACAPETRAPS